MTDADILRRACELRGHAWQSHEVREKCRYCDADRPAQWVDLGGFGAVPDGEPVTLRHTSTRPMPIPSTITDVLRAMAEDFSA